MNRILNNIIRLFICIILLFTNLNFIQFLQVKAENVESVKSDSTSEVAKEVLAASADVLTDKSLDKTAIRKANSKLVEFGAKRTVYEGNSGEKFVEIKSQKTNRLNKLSESKYFQGSSYFSVSYDNSIKFTYDKKQFEIIPVNANNVKPESYLEGVIYRNIWKDIDLFYQLEDETIKEFIYINSRNANVENIRFEYKGGDIVSEKIVNKSKLEDYSKNAPNGPVPFEEKEGKIKNYLVNGSTKLLLEDYTIETKDQGFLTDENRPIKSFFNKNSLSLTVDNSWYSKLTDKSFPLILDPYIPGGNADSAQYRSVHSRGYICNPHDCPLYIGGRTDSAGSYIWRNEFYIPYEEVIGNYLTGANLYLERDARRNDGGGNINNNTPVWVSWANCIGYNCTSGDQSVGWGTSAYYINITATLNWMSKNNIRGGWLMVWTNGGNSDYKAFEPAKTRLDLSYVPANPAQPENRMGQYQDWNGRCNNGGTCGYGGNVNLPSSNWYDGIFDCNYQNLEFHQLWLSNFDNSLRGWQREIRSATDFGNMCKWDQINYTKWYQNGTYNSAYETRVKNNGKYSGWGNVRTFSVDYSPPVKIGANIALPEYNNNQIQVVLPQYTDDSLYYVTIRNSQTGNLLDAGGGLDWGGNELYRAYPGGGETNKWREWVMEGNGLIRNRMTGYCLGVMGTYPQGYYTDASCDNANYDQWGYNAETKEITTNWNGYCMEVVTGILRGMPCNGAQNQKWDINFSNYNDFVSDKAIQYTVVKTDAITGAWEGDQTPWIENTNINIVFNTDKKYNIYYKARDRRVDNANLTPWILYGYTTRDSTKPIIDNSSLKITPVNQIEPKDNEISDVKSYATIKFNYIEANVKSIKLLIFKDNISTYDKAIRILENTNGSSEFRVDAAGLQEGKYVVQAVVFDKTCSSDQLLIYTLQSCNNVSGFTTDSSFIVDRSGANISISLPQNYIWTNNKNYEINGQIGVYNNPLKVDKDTYKLKINNNDIPFAANGVYSYKTTLTEGENVFNFVSTDRGLNQISKYGDPAVSLTDKLVVNLDTVPPLINSITEVNGKVRFSFSDERSGVKGLTISLYKSSDNSVYSKIGDLIYDNIVYNTTYAKSYSCPTAIYCDLELQNLTDGYYKIFVGLKDNASNLTCTFQQFPYVCSSLATFNYIKAVGNVSLATTPIVDDKQIIKLELNESLLGNNSDQDILDLQNKVKNIDQMQGLTVKLKVAQGVEYVNMKYSYDSNVANKQIARINSILDDRTQYNGRNKDNNISGQPCLLAECEWKYTIVYDKSLPGGKLKIDFESSKNGLLETFTKEFNLNSRQVGIPHVMKTVVLVTNNTNDQRLAYKYRDVYYTNNSYNRIFFGADPNQTYNIIINGITYTLKTNDYGIGSIDTNITIDGTFPVTYNGSLLTSIVKDTVSPTITAVTIRNLKNTNINILPFVKAKDDIEYTYTSSEGLLWSHIRGADNYRGYGDKKVTATTAINCLTSGYSELLFLNQLATPECNDLWFSSKIQVGSIQATDVEGIAAQKIYMEDYAGNIATYSGINGNVDYSTTPKTNSLDLRLFVDRTIPDKQELDTTLWKDNKDGVLADGLNPEIDRLGSGQPFVIRGGKVTIKFKAEYNARAYLYVTNKFAVTSTVLLNPTNQNCVSGVDKKTADNLTVKMGSLCDLTYTYTFPTDGSQTPLGQANYNYTLAVSSIDLSGNISPISTNNIVVYDDKTGSAIPRVESSSLDTTKPINIDGEIGYTMSNKVRISTVGENSSDSVYNVTNPKNIVTNKYNRKSQKTDINGVITTENIMDCTVTPCRDTGQKNNFQSSIEIGLGTTESDTTFAMVGNRRVGTGEDGIYSIDVKDVDTAGNDGLSKIVKIERDTVAPVKPTVTFDTSAEQTSKVIKILASGESKTKVLISGTTKSTGIVDNKFNAIWDGTYKYSTKYTWEVRLQDIAGNISEAQVVTYTTIAAPKYINYCKATGVDTPSYPFENEHGINQAFSATHGGIDFGTKNIKTDTFDRKVIASAKGVVESAAFNSKGGNEIYIMHANGIGTGYSHLDKMYVKNGDIVEAGQEIGVAGATGTNAHGEHLHFYLQVNRVSVDPNMYLNKCATQGVAGNQDPKVLQDNTPVDKDFQGNELDPWNNKTFDDYVVKYGDRKFIDIYVDENNITLDSKLRYPKSLSKITYAKEFPDRVEIYGLSPSTYSQYITQPGATVRIQDFWTVAVHKTVSTTNCVLNDYTCQNQKTYQEISQQQYLVDPLKYTVFGNVYITDSSINSYVTTATLDSIKNSNYGKTTVVDNKGHWKVTVNKIGTNKFQNAGGKVLDISNGISVGAYVNYSLNVDLQEFKQLVNVGSITNTKAIVPNYEYKTLDQLLFVDGSGWNKDPQAYYDEKYLDARIVKLVPVINGKVVEGMTKLPDNVYTINLFAHGWTNSINISNKTDRNSSELQNWIKGYNDISFTETDNLAEDSLKMAKINSVYDPESVSGKALNIALVWRDASVDLLHGGDPLSSTLYSAISPVLGIYNYASTAHVPVPTEASKWIIPVAETITKHLDQFRNNSSKNNLYFNCSGHSLGAYICNETGKQLKMYYSNFSRVQQVLIDPANEGVGNLRLNLNGRSATYIDYSNSTGFRSNYLNSIAINAQSWCSNYNSATTANIILTLSFSNDDTFSGICNRHSKAPGIYKEILKNNREIIFTGLYAKRLMTLRESDFSSNMDKEVILKTTNDDSQIGYAMIKIGSAYDWVYLTPISVFSSYTKVGIYNIYGSNSLVHSYDYNKNLMSDSQVSYQFSPGKDFGKLHYYNLFNINGSDKFVLDNMVHD